VRTRLLLEPLSSTLTAQRSRKPTTLTRLRNLHAVVPQRTLALFRISGTLGSREDLASCGGRESCCDGAQ
jgi:hypothetical protein